MTDYRKYMLREVLNNPVYQNAIKKLSPEQIEMIEGHLANFVDGFGMTLVKAASATHDNRNVSEELTKALEKMDGTVFSGSKDK